MAYIMIYYKPNIIIVVVVVVVVIIIIIIQCNIVKKLTSKINHTFKITQCPLQVVAFIAEYFPSIT
jgi:flagellar biogenesis protein FliO